jgi:hypothetical protein
MSMQEKHIAIGIEKIGWGKLTRILPRSTKQ